MKLRSMRLAQFLLVLVLMMSGCNILSTDVFDETSLDRDQIEQFTGLRFPNSIEGLRFAIYQALDTTAYVTFRIPKSDLQFVLDQVSSGLTLKDNYNPFYASMFIDKPWWQPNSVDKFSGAEHINWQTNRAYWILVGRDDHDIHAIYMIIATTP